MKNSTLKQSALKHWSTKFRNAFRGLRVGVRGQSSFCVHFSVSILVFLVASFLQVSLMEWCILLLCMGLVLSAELVNSSIECMAKAITKELDDDIRDALDIASSAVLVASVFSAVVGLTILVFRFGLFAGLWGGYLVF